MSTVGHRMLRIWVDSRSNDMIRISVYWEVSATWCVESKVQEQVKGEVCRELSGKDVLSQANRINGRQLYNKSLSMGSV